MVSKETFVAYMKVQKSGITNMFDTPYVRHLAKKWYNIKMAKEDCLYIIEHYRELKIKYFKEWGEIFKEVE